MRVMFCVLVIVGFLSVAKKSVAQGTDCFSFIGRTESCFATTQQDRFCTGECEAVLLTCLNNVAFQEQYDNTSEWDDVNYEPDGETGYHSEFSYGVVCLYTANCICIPSAESSTGLVCVADLTTEVMDTQTVYELNSDNPCIPEPEEN